MKFSLTRHSHFPFHSLFRVLVIGFLFTTHAASVATAATRMGALPQHFGIGLRSPQAELSWMTGSGVPWGYRYQYVNPGWKDWNAPAGSGNVAYNYTNDSVNNGYIPVLSWYIVAGTSPNLWNNLSSTSYMKSYYADFSLLMKKVAATVTTKPVIVHVEPDLWGFMQQKYGDDPTVIPVSVASSGYTGLATLPNDAAGFAQALVAIRDVDAPNVILAWHASLWGPNNGYNPTLTNPASYQTPQATGNRIVTFYNNLHAPFDMIFHDTADRDSGFAVTVCSTPSSAAWWTDSAFTNFQTYLGAIYQGTSLRSILWQTPEGNTLYRSENNTTFHYQDNRAQYFLMSENRQHISNYVGVGVIGILFGMGQGEPYSQCDSSKSDTDHMDYAGDGITNPAAINGNTLVATYPDDDGGFLRASTAAYYSAPISTSTSTADTTPPSTPTGLTATRVSSSQINLAWNASTDNVTVAGYKIFRNSTQIATVNMTSYNNTGLAPSTTYSYQVAAYDAAGNTSVLSSAASATTSRKRNPRK